MKSSQPVVLATASDWVVPGSVMRSAISDMKDGSNQFTSVRLLKSDEIRAIVREGRRENPIDICDDSDEGDLSCDEELSNSENKSVEGMDEFVTGSDFDADVVFASSVDIFGGVKNDKIVEVSHEEKQPELNISLRLDTTDQLRKAKRRMEYCFMDDYSMKMKPFRRLNRPDYEGEYTFIV